MGRGSMSHCTSSPLIQSTPASTIDRQHRVYDLLPLHGLLQRML